MNLYTNSTAADSLRNAFYAYTKASDDIMLASPFFTYDSLVSELLGQSCRVKLIIRLCTATSPSALSKIIDEEGIQIRYFTSQLFHSKLYIFGNDVALVGSANLTSAGMQSNREIAIEIPGEDDRFDRLVSLFSSYWNQADVLTRDRLRTFDGIRKSFSGASIDAQCEKEITNIFGDLKPSEGIQVGVKKPSKEKIYLESYRRTYQEFLNAYRVVEKEYLKNGNRKVEEDKLPLRIEIDQFFSFIRETYTTGESFLNEPLRSVEGSRQLIGDRLNSWFNSSWDYLTTDIPDHYSTIHAVFSSEDAIDNATIEDLFDAVDNCHAFHDRYRFYKGGHATMKKEFIRDNDIARLRSTYKYLLFGRGDFIDRMGTCIYDDAYYLHHFGRSCIQELYGWVNKENIPICNGRTVKALRYLGFDVKIFS